MKNQKTTPAASTENAADITKTTQTDKTVGTAVAVDTAGNPLREEDIMLAPAQEENAVAFAEALPDKKRPSADKKKALAIREEVREMRGADRKIFRKSDGTMEAVFYAGPVHVPDGHGGFADMTATQPQAEADDKHFLCDSGSFRARFSREQDNAELFSVEKDKYRVTVSAAASRKKRKKRLPATLREAQGHEVAPLLAFADAEPGADYTYAVNGKGVKENIVIREKAESYRYPFLLSAEHLTVTADNGGKRVSLCDSETGEEIFHIPAPFMCDAAGVTSDAVRYVTKQEADGLTRLTVVADSAFVDAEDRAFPVTVDPQIMLTAAGAVTSYGWDGTALSQTETVHTVCGVSGASNRKAHRMYLDLGLSGLPANARIRKATLSVIQKSAASDLGIMPRVGLYRATSQTGTDSNPIDYAPMTAGDGVAYTFDITRSLAAAFKSQSNARYAVRLINEADRDIFTASFYGTRSVSAKAPTLTVEYETDYSVNTSGQTHTHSLGRFGQGIIDLQYGNLMFVSQDFAWNGRRMPLTIRHLYNSALSDAAYTAGAAANLEVADFSAMKLGLGMKLDLMQSMVPSSCICDDAGCRFYLYTDSNGQVTRFTPQDTVCRKYASEDDSHTVYDAQTRTLTQGGKTMRFDDAGRLIRITDADGNQNVITYTNGQIISVTDGADRSFAFTYNASGYLTGITAPDGTAVSYTYASGRLSGVTYPGGDAVAIAYAASGKPASVTLRNAAGQTLYEVAYTFTGDCLTEVREIGTKDGVASDGATTAYDYSMASGATVVTTTEAADGTEEANVIRGVYTFDDDGQLIHHYFHSKDTGSVAGSAGGSGINPFAGEGSVEFVSNVCNLLTDPRLATLGGWSEMPGNCCVTTGIGYYSLTAPYGYTARKLTAECATGTECGFFQLTDPLPAGQYTFSAYVQIEDRFVGTEAPGVYLRIAAVDGTVLCETEHLNTQGGFVRLTASCAIDAEQNLKVCLLADGRGSACLCAAQLENSAAANPFNPVENGNFEKGTDKWTVSDDGITAAEGECFNMSHALCIPGNIAANRYVSQVLPVKTTRNIRETFTLSGWAKGYGLPDREREGVDTPPVFRLRAVVKYNDKQKDDFGTEEFVADFSPCTDEWQPASVQFCKSRYRTVESITVFCEYGYNVGNAYFDDIQLTVDSVETHLTAADFETDTDDDTEETETEEQITEAAADNFSEAKDAYGNPLTQTSFHSDEFGTLYRSFGYNASGNDLVRKTDARGNTTTYTVNGTTSRNEEVTDRLGNKTAYEYDDAGRTTKVTSKKADGTELANVSYAYDAFDNMTEIVRGDGMKYVLSYNAFHNLQSIGIDGKEENLIAYTYKNGNGRLKQVTYANGDTMKATYDSVGRMMSEKWYNASGVQKAHYLYGYDGKGNIVRSLDIFAQKEYDYIYDDGNLVCATEYAVTLTGEFVTGRTIVATVRYFYDKDGKLTHKTVTASGAPEHTVRYVQTEDNTTVSFAVPEPTAEDPENTRTVTCRSKADSFGRKAFDEIQIGCDFISRQYAYAAGRVTDEHKATNKVKSSPTTQLVSQIVFSGGRTVSYEYDEEERITRVTDSAIGSASYTYDAQGQLETETVGGVTTRFAYDAYGNIIAKGVVDSTGEIAEATKIVYTYGNTIWRDLLTAYNGQSITYDAQGNPTSYLGHTLTWEKGRQLKSFDNNTYTYNANGIRTSKTVNGVKHTYTLEGTKILCEAWGDNTLIPLRDNTDTVCGILYNNVPYYFQRNLQGDIIGILNKDAAAVATYAYDAWGVCSIVTDTSDCAIAAINPFRYRGYYYDEEIGLYYLQSRYYAPAVGRFLNADGVNLIHLSGNNLFLYCHNNPGTLCDYSGRIATPFAEIAIVCASLFVVIFALSIAMYAYAAIGARYNDNVDFSAWWNPIGILMRNRLKDSKLIKERIELYIGRISKKSYSHTEHINFGERKKYIKDKDLWLSVRNASNCTITVTKTGSKRWFSSKYKYKVRIVLSDTYDFAKFDKEKEGLIITAINNGLGYYPMQWGLLKSYTWCITYEFNYYY